MIGEIVRCDTCGAPGAADVDVCDVCNHEMTAGLECGRGLTQLSLHPAVRFRFVDVLDELHAIAGMAGEGASVDGEAVAAACRRAESLLLLLRRQFLYDVVVSDLPPSARRPA